MNNPQLGKKEYDYTQQNVRCVSGAKNLFKPVAFTTTTYLSLQISGHEECYFQSLNIDCQGLVFSPVTGRVWLYYNQAIEFFAGGYSAYFFFMDKNFIEKIFRGPGLLELVIESPGVSSYVVASWDAWISTMGTERAA